MGFYIVKGNLLELKYDAIVIPSQPSLRLEGIIGNEVKKCGGDRLKLELEQIKHPNITECVITNAFNMYCDRLIHVANPKWDTTANDEEKEMIEEQLAESYRNCLVLAQDYGLESIAFPLLSTGAYEFPKRRAIEIAIDTITDFLTDSDLTVALVINNINTYDTYRDIFKNYHIIGGHLSKQTKEDLEMIKRERGGFKWNKKNTYAILEEGTKNKKVNERLEYYISQKGLTKTKCYAGIISKSAFNNIMNGTSIPKKKTIVALGLHMGLNRWEIDDLLAPIGEMLNELLDYDQIIIQELYLCKNRGHPVEIDRINELLGSQGFEPLVTYEL